LGALGRLPVKEVLNIAWVPLLFIGVFFLLLPCHSHAFKGDFEAGKRSGGMRGEARDRGLESERSWIEETGLTPAFPEGFRCASISSPFASRFDGAGNRRKPTIHGGKHVGVDIGFQVGHPEVAMADGEIIAKGPAESDGAQMEDSLHVDMMALFVKGITLETAKENPSYTNIEKAPQVAVADSLGGRSDPNAKIVWPVVCNFPQ
jgi:hypothetical protein